MRCLKWANRHGLVLLRWGKFAPPLPLLTPLPVTAKNNALAEREAIGKKAAGSGNGGGGRGKTYYSPRRHQSGRSFTNWRGWGKDNSETLVFGKACDHLTPLTREDANESTNLLLPWERDTSRNNATHETVAHLDKLEGGVKSVIPRIKEPWSNGDNADPFPCKYC